MRYIVDILAAGSWSKETAVDSFTADYEGRHRRRASLALQSGERVMLELEHPRLLREGDGLKLDDGRLICVHALPEQLMEITAHTPLHLLQLAWHIGNRHLPAAIEARRILVREDHVIAEMLRGLGAHVHHIEAAFDPEGGAYAQRHHDHGH
ncbi:MAG: urease accessory protein UreE [Acetobacter papayae]|uniref:urease accessory protein UreE n=1 Tax=Acetobacter papayae TaxID=1076592 RepID=UPI0039ECC3AF